VDLELTERWHQDWPGGGPTVIAPDDIWINGQPVLIPKSSRVIVHADGERGVTVDLTLFVRQLRIGGIERPAADEPTPLYDSVCFLFDMNPIGAQ
jgi:hypothetical protein